MNDPTFTDDTPMRAGELAAYMRMGRSTIYADIHAGYVFEFATRKRTTPGHYKAWLRAKASELATNGVPLTPAEKERQDRELGCLRGNGNGKSPRTAH
jgi:hypothetical protein